MDNRQRTPKNLFPPAKNKPAIFITNSLDELRGSSLYLVFVDGTIRFASHHDEKKEPTIFIYSSTIRYYDFSEEKPEYLETATVGLNTVEQGKIKVHEEKIKTKLFGHLGHTITEIIKMEQLLDPTFTPKTWINNDEVGLPWKIAVGEVMAAYETVKDKNGVFISKEFPFKKANNTPSLP